MLRSLIAAGLAFAVAVAPARAASFGLVAQAESHLGQTSAQLGLPRSLWCADFLNMLLGGGTGDRHAQSFAHYGSPARAGCTDCIAVIALGRGLDLPVVAEGVETEAQLKFLASENCNEIQGYFVGRPKPIADYAEVVGRAPGRRDDKRNIAIAG